MGFDVQKIKQKLFHRDSDSNEEDFIEEIGTPPAMFRMMIQTRQNAPKP